MGKKQKKDSNDRTGGAGKKGTHDMYYINIKNGQKKVGTVLESGVKKKQRKKENRQRMTHKKTDNETTRTTKAKEKEAAHTKRKRTK